MSTKTKIVHFFAGMACAALALPFGMVAAVLAPVLLGFVKELYLHFTRKGADAAHFAWLLAGAATLVLCARLVPIRL